MPRKHVPVAVLAVVAALLIPGTSRGRPVNPSPPPLAPEVARPVPIVPANGSGDVVASWGFEAGGPGWHSEDLTASGGPYFQRVTAGTFGEDPLDPTIPLITAGGSTASIWVGLTWAEVAGECWVSRGYGNVWSQDARKTYTYAGGAVTIEFDFFADSEADFDITYLYVEADGELSEPLNTSYGYGYSGSRTEGNNLGLPGAPLHQSPITVPPSNLPAVGEEFTVVFRFVSDGFVSDEDGNLNSNGAFGFDNFSITGVYEVAFDDFESGTEGWEFTGTNPGVGSLMHVTGIDFPGCDLTGSALLASAPAMVVVGAPSDYMTGPAGGAFVFEGGLGMDEGADTPLSGVADGDEFGTSVGSAGDVNGDGDADVIVGAPRNDVNGIDCGAAYIFHGGPGMDAVPDMTLPGAYAFERFGTSVGAAGDVNDDGCADVIVGAPENDVAAGNAGAAYIFFGGPAMDVVADVTLLGASTGDRFGTSVGAAGDVNGDGYADVIVGAPSNNTAGTGAGAAYVYFGGPGMDATADVTLLGASADDAFGTAVGTAGDLDNDDYADVIVGAPGADGEEAGSGAVYVFYGGPGMDAVADRTLPGLSAGEAFGTSLATLVTTDLYHGSTDEDIVVGAPGNDDAGADAGAAYVFLSCSAPADLVLPGQAAGDDFGRSVGSAGDVNDDGETDLIVGAPGYGLTGAAYVFHCGDVMDATADRILVGAVPGDRFGLSVGGIPGRLHPEYQTERLVSPEVGIEFPEHITAIYVDADIYSALPLSSGVRYRLRAYYQRPSGECPEVGADKWSRTPVGPNLYQYGGEPSCDRQRTDLTTHIPADATKIKVVIEVIASCSGIFPCDYPSGVNSSPYFDNVEVVVVHPILAGVVFKDLDCDGTRDAGEDGLAEFEVTLDPGGHSATTGADGTYAFYDIAPGTYTLNVGGQTGACWAPCTGLPISVELGGGTVQDIGLDLDHDLAVTGSVGPLVQAEEVIYVVNYRNLGDPTPAGEDVIVTLELESLLSCVEAVDGTCSATGAEWHLGQLDAGEQGWLQARLLVSPGTQGELVNITSRIDVGGPPDCYPADNIYMDTHVIVGSYDPNDKVVVPSGEMAPEQVLDYRIRFQNVGNYPASDVVVRDTLDGNLDLATLSLVASSHPNTFQLDGREAIWTFTGINLPDSTSDWPGSQGFVTFTIQPLPELPGGTVIENRAGIYFDTNPVVLTNVVSNTIGVLAIEPAPELPARVALAQSAPNPFTTTTTIRFALPGRARVALRVYDGVGRRVRTLVAGEREGGFHTAVWDGRDDSGTVLPSGIYYCRLRTGDDVATRAMLLLR